MFNCNPVPRGTKNHVNEALYTSRLALAGSGLQVVLEIACDQIQKSTRHASGYAMRFPRIIRIRWDKRAEDADLLARVAELYHSAHNFAHDALQESRSPMAEPTLFDGL